jgi:hypothetical protein
MKINLTVGQLLAATEPLETLANNKTLPLPDRFLVARLIARLKPDLEAAQRTNLTCYYDHKGTQKGTQVVVPDEELPTLNRELWALLIVKIPEFEAAPLPMSLLEKIPELTGGMLALLLPFIEEEISK